MNNGMSGSPSGALGVGVICHPTAGRLVSVSIGGEPRVFPPEIARALAAQILEAVGLCVATPENLRGLATAAESGLTVVGAGQIILPGKG